MTKTIIDVRTPDEYSQGHIEGAVNISLSDINNFEKYLTLSKDSQIILYCQSGNRSAIAIQILDKKGYSNLINGINQDTVQAKYR